MFSLDLFHSFEQVILSYFFFVVENLTFELDKS